jgi:hypothetical protein
MVAMQEINTAKIDLLIMTELAKPIGPPNASELACTGAPRVLHGAPHVWPAGARLRQAHKTAVRRQQPE